MKISHEVPLSLLNRSRDFNDYDYCLVHHYKKYPEYRSFFLESKQMGRQIILDNSVVELGESFEIKEYLEVDRELRPNIIIAPDDPLSSERNLELLTDFREVYSGSGLVMGVPHGSNYLEYSDNYSSVEPLVDVVGVSVPKFMDRYLLIERLCLDRVVNKSKTHHLLGCILPQEFSKYGDRYRFIESLDTSSPVVHGFYGVEYSNYGLDSKLKYNIDSIVESEVSESQLNLVLYNIKRFKNILHGNNSD